MGIQIDREDIWMWHERIEDFLSEGLPRSAFCRKHNYPINTFINRYNRIIYKSIAYPELYNKLVPIARKYMGSSVSQSQFLKEHDISKALLTDMCIHLKYVDIIGEMKAQRNPQPMNFIQVPTIPTSNDGSPFAIEAEVVKKQNDVELTISSGVKVVVAPEVGADKLVRIIELLKDL